MRDILQEYISETPDLMEFYAHPLSNISNINPQKSSLDAELIQEINQYNDRLGNKTTLKGDELTIATGQQPALFSGPLYTIYKAITAVKLAAKVERDLQKKCVPIFWIGSDDHDFEEASSAHFFTKNDDILSLTYKPGENVAGFPISRVPLDRSINNFIDEAAIKTRGSEFRTEVAKFLHDSAAQSASLADWTARILARLFKDTPLVIFDPHLPSARKLSQGIINKEISEPLTTTQIINETGDRLKELGYKKQVDKGPDECCFFVEMGSRRRKVTFDGMKFHLPQEQISCTSEELIAFLEASPERFSPNVALRCIVQQKLLSPLAYVVGPGELAYWGQFKPLFDHFNLDMPIVYPRAQCILTTTKLNKLLASLGITHRDLLEPIDSLKEKGLRSLQQAPVTEIINSHSTRIEEILRELETDLTPHTKTASPIVEGILKKTQEQFSRLERSILYENKAQTETVQARIMRLCTALAPDRKPQERVYNIFSFLFEHGWDLIPRLIDELDIESFEINEVEL